MTRPACAPLVMKVLEPLMTHSSPSRLAVVFRPWRSEPASGSVMPIAVIISPLQNFGSQRCFCSSVVRRVRYGAQTSEWIVKRRGVRHPGARQLLVEDRVVAEVDVAAAVLLRDRDAQEPGIARGLPHLRGDPPRLPDLLGARQDLAIHERGGRLAKQLVIVVEERAGQRHAAGLYARCSIVACACVHRMTGLPVI